MNEIGEMSKEKGKFLITCRGFPFFFSTFYSSYSYSKYIAAVQQENEIEVSLSYCIAHSMNE